MHQYVVEETYQAITTQLVPIDEEVWQLADWLTTQTRAAMQKGAELAIAEMQKRIDALEAEEREGWCGHCACQSCYDAKRRADHW